MTLEEFINSNPEPRELKRALAVKMRLEGMKHRQIQPILGVSSNYISRWEQRYREQGVQGLKLAHKGSQGYLSDEQRQTVITWIAQEPQRNLWDVIGHIESNYGVRYRSLQSYYDLLKSSGMSWHQGQKKVPNTMNLWCSSTTRGLPHG
ncbi:MAG: helix-turn-helix domain-containing protein [Cyanobacteria bacterium J06597_1]